MSLTSDGTELIGRAAFPAFLHPLRTILKDDPLYPLTHSVEETTVDDEDDAGELKMTDWNSRRCWPMGITQQLTPFSLGPGSNPGKMFYFRANKGFVDWVKSLRVRKGA